ncbi:MAG: ribulose-phosphate 3-epimerase [Bacteroidota bacterium]
MSHLIAPSLLAADFLHLQRMIELVNQSAGDWLHFDVMDGHFVPNISFGFPVLKAIKPISAKPIDVHLMIERPELYLEAFRDAGANVLTVHVEACKHLDRTVRRIQELGMKAGVALNPATPIEAIAHILPVVDVVLLMSVNPGFGGQSFLSYVLDKSLKLKRIIQENGYRSLIEIDGGIDEKTGPLALNHGVDVLVAGSYIFKHPTPLEAAKHLKSLQPNPQWV